MIADTLYVGAGLHLGVIRQDRRILWRDTVQCGSERRALERAGQELKKRQRPPRGGR